MLPIVRCYRTEKIRASCALVKVEPVCGSALESRFSLRTLKNSQQIQKIPKIQPNLIARFRLFHSNPGKTENTKKVIQYLAYVASSKPRTSSSSSTTLQSVSATISPQSGDCASFLTQSEQPTNRRSHRLSNFAFAPALLPGRTRAATAAGQSDSGGLR